ncbi:MAG: acyltransferase family protein [Ginsengibacter sp.]
MNYKPRLDGLRFVAIMMVMLEHFVYFLGSKVSGGFYGVNLFFVLSGYLITCILLADESKRFKEAYTRFLLRRILRIFPVYYLAILFLFMINAEGIYENLQYLLTYTYNYKLGESKQWNTLYSPYWSLSVEEQFYILFPVVVLLCRRHSKVLFSLFIAIIIAGYSQIYFNVFNIEKYNYVGLPTNMSFLALGAIGALFTKKEYLSEKFFSSRYIEITVFVVLIFSLIYRNWHFKELLLPLLNLYLVIKASSFSFKIKVLDKFLTSRKVIYVGRISYGIYLYHLLIGYLITTYLFDPIWFKIPFNSFGILSKLQYNAWIVKFPIVVLATILIASLSFHCIERPILRFKDKFFQKRNTGSPGIALVPFET